MVWQINASNDTIIKSKFFSDKSTLGTVYSIKIWIKSVVT